VTFIRRLLVGAVAGAAGTTALNAATFVDMAARARPASDLPQQAVDVLASKTGHPIPGGVEEKQNRLAGLGPLVGATTGVGIGVLAGLGTSFLRRIPEPVAALAVATAAMIAADTPLAGLRLTNPKSWSATEWLSDVVPHVVYGTVTYATLQAFAY